MLKHSSTDNRKPVATLGLIVQGEEIMLLESQRVVILEMRALGRDYIPAGCSIYHNPKSEAWKTQKIVLPIFFFYPNSSCYLSVVETNLQSKYSQKR